MSDSGFNFMTAAELAALDTSTERVRSLEQELCQLRRRKSSPINFIRQIMWEHIYAVSTVCERTSELPRGESGVYFVVNFDGGPATIRYIGKAVDLYRRWKGHQHKKLVDGGQEYLLWKRPDYQSFGSLEAEEAYLIALFRPQYNRLIKCPIFPDENHPAHIATWSTRVIQ